MVGRDDAATVYGTDEQMNQKMSLKKEGSDCDNTKNTSLSRKQMEHGQLDYQSLSRPYDIP
jgi:hypothetical protein